MMDERKRLTAEGRELLSSLYAICSLMAAYSEKFQRLCGRVPNGWRDFRMAQTRLEKILEGVLDTVPLEQLQAVKHQVETTDIHTTTRRASARPKNLWVITYDDLADLAEYAAKTECICCNGKNGPCRLRDILRDLPIQGVDRVIVPCWRDD